MSMKVMYLFIYLFVYFFKKGNLIPSFSLFFKTMVCIFALNEDCTAFLCFVFTLCV